QENGCIIKEKTPTPFRNYRPSVKGLHLIDTFSACTGEKPGRYLIPYFSGFCPAWTIREHYYDTKKTYLIVFFPFCLGGCLVIYIFAFVEINSKMCFCGHKNQILPDKSGV
ncbi:hypothetical protein, partial [Phocaeicola vulgatus]